MKNRRIRASGIFVLFVFAALVIVGISNDAGGDKGKGQGGGQQQVRVCGTSSVPAFQSDMHCGGDASGKGGCGPKDFCCPNTTTPVCKSSLTDLWKSSTCTQSQGDACQMSAKIDACGTGKVPNAARCTANLQCTQGNFCCPAGPNFNLNEISLLLFTTCKDPAGICQCGGTPPPTPTPTPPGPTPTPTPQPSAGHTMHIINTCNVPIWIGAVTGGDPFLVNNGPPPWGANGTPSWQIDGKNICCTDATAQSCDPAHPGCNTDKDCQQDKPWTTCALGKGKNSQDLIVPIGWNTGALIPRMGCKMVGGNFLCQVAQCGNGVLNCGTGGNGVGNGTLAEFTMDTPTGDNYDASMVAAFHVLMVIKPSASGCDTVGDCDKLPDCPWDKFVKDNDNNGNLRSPQGDEIGVCLAPDKFVGNIFVPPGQNPFQNIKPWSDDDLKIRCTTANTTVNPPIAGVCGDPSPSHGFNCSPWKAKKGAIDITTGCISSFGPSEPCHPADCAEPQDFAGLPYLNAQICDPYGQCDVALSHNNKWPIVCKPGKNPCPQQADQVDTKQYFENIHSACPGFSSKRHAPYAWSYDDPFKPGASGGLGTCNAAGRRDYTVTISCQ